MALSLSCAAFSKEISYAKKMKAPKKNWLQNERSVDSYVDDELGGYLTGFG